MSKMEKSFAAHLHWTRCLDVFITAFGPQARLHQVFIVVETVLAASPVPL